MFLIILKAILSTVVFLTIVVIVCIIFSSFLAYISYYYDKIKSMPKFFKKIPFKTMFKKSEWLLQVRAQGLNQFDNNELYYKKYNGYQLIAYIKVRFKASYYDELNFYEDKAIIWSYKNSKN